jgi:hypothetical protein
MSVVRGAKTDSSKSERAGRHMSEVCRKIESSRKNLARRQQVFHLTNILNYQMLTYGSGDVKFGIINMVSVLETLRGEESTKKEREKGRIFYDRSLTLAYLILGLHHP